MSKTLIVIAVTLSTGLLLLLLIPATYLLGAVFDGMRLLKAWGRAHLMPGVLVVALLTVAAMYQLGEW